MSTFSPPGGDHGAAFSRPGALQGRSLVVVDGALALIGILLMVQMWLVTAALESFLAGHREVAVPAAVLSGLIFAGCAALYRFVESLDAELRPRA